MKSLIRSLVPEAIINSYHLTLAHVAAFWYRYPSKQMQVVGVTGTNGKSTTVQFIGQLLESAGHRVGWTTSASFKVAEDEWVNNKKMTMLGRFQTQKLLRDMVRAGCTHAIVETSSQGIAQHRHVGIDYDVAVFTNLTPEHIESHGGFDAYKQAKGRLFEVTKGTHVLNMDDEHVRFFESFAADHKRYFSVKQTKDVHMDATCTTFTLQDRTFHLKPVGPFYLANTLAAIEAVRALGVEWDDIQEGVQKLKPIPGRLEFVDEGQPFSIIVDFAAEPAGLEALYKVVNIMDHKRVIHIMGSCGGGRDAERRGSMGARIHELADVLIVTNEDPYDEDPMCIIDAVADGALKAGAKEEEDLFRILDRQEAINKAISLANAGDIVLLTGKGSEVVMAVAGGKKIPWDDREAARTALKQRYD